MTGQQVNLIEPTDPQYFKVSSDKLYDRHIYRLHLTNDKCVDFDDYDMLRATWFQTAKQFLSHVEIIDVQEKLKGF